MKRVLLVMQDHFLSQALPIITKRLPDFEVIAISADEREERITLAMQAAEFLIYTGIRITRQMMRKATNLRLIQKWGSGVDSVDLEAANELGIRVANVRGGNAVAVSEHCFGLMLAIYKRICYANINMHSKRWLQSELVTEGIEEVNGRTLGIVGMGQIGEAIAFRAKAFGLDLLYYKRTQLPDDEEKRLELTYLPLDKLLPLADIVVLALPLTNETRGLFDRRILQQMKPPSILINVSRGEIVNEADLYDALTNGTIRGAALDVFESEPPYWPDRLVKLENVIATPHIAGRSKQAMTYITEQCAANILLIASGSNPKDEVGI